VTVKSLLRLSIILSVLATMGIGMIQAQEPESVCLITDLGRINDGTFNQFAYEGMARAADEFDLDNKFIETQSQTDYAANIATCVDEGFEIIITVGFLLADDTRAAAEANPDKWFIGVDAFFEEGAPENLVGLQFREDQAGFLAGAMAALMTESEIVGGVYGIDIPPVIRFRNGFEQGVAYVNPDVEALGVYIDDFQAPDRGAAAAEQFIGEGADVIFGAGGPTGSGGILQAAQQEVYVIGVDQDEYFTTFGEGETPGSEYLITSAIKRVDNGVFDMVEAAIDGEFPGPIYILSVDNDGIGFAPPHDAEVPEEVIEEVTAIQEGLGEGEIETGVDFVTGQLIDEMEDMDGEEMDEDMEEDMSEEDMEEPAATEEAED